MQLPFSAPEISISDMDWACNRLCGLYGLVSMLGDTKICLISSCDAQVSHMTVSSTMLVLNKVAVPGSRVYGIRVC